MSEPIQDGGELDEGEKSAREFVVASGDAAEAFDPAKEVFDVVSAAVVAVMEADGSATIAARRDTNSGALLPKVCTEAVGIECLVADRTLVPQSRNDRGDCLEVMLLAGRKAQSHRPAMPFDHGGEFCVKPSLGSPDRMPCLSARRVRPVLMQFDMGTIKMTQLSGRLSGEQREQACPKPAFAPTTPASVNRIPRTKCCRHVTPRTSRAQHIPNGSNHQPIIFGWPAPNPANRTPPLFAPAQVNFFSRSHSGSGNSMRLVNLMRSPPTFLPSFGSLGFENTP